jgi:hypothetical protein
MKRCLIAAALLAAGCNNVGTALVMGQTLAPADFTKCMFDPGSTITLGDITFDVFGQQGLSLNIKATNNLQPLIVNFGTDMRPDNFMAPHTITPRSMDVSYECDANAFTAELGPLYLPQFSTTQPFCINRQTKEFVGRDVVLASGSPILPLGSGVIEVTVIPAPLGQAFADLFNAAKLAKLCCDSTGTGGCSDTDLASAPQMPDSACGKLQNFFDTIAGPNKLSSRSFADISKFLGYGMFDAEVVTPTRGSLPPTYPIRIRGIVEGVTGDMTVVHSTEWSDVIHICGHCGNDPMINPNVISKANGSTPCTDRGP